MKLRRFKTKVLHIPVTHMQRSCRLIEMAWLPFAQQTFVLRTCHANAFMTFEANAVHENGPPPSSQHIAVMGTCLADAVKFI